MEISTATERIVMRRKTKFKGKHGLRREEVILRTGSTTVTPRSAWESPLQIPSARLRADGQ